LLPIGVDRMPVSDFLGSDCNENVRFGTSATSRDAGQGE